MELTNKEQELFDLLAPGNLSVSQLSSEQRTMVRNVLSPQAGRGWTDEQQEFGDQWFLLADPQAIAAVNALLPPSYPLAGIPTVAHGLVLRAAPLFDCNPGNFAPAASVLFQLKIIRLSAADFASADELL